MEKWWSRNWRTVVYVAAAVAAGAIVAAVWKTGWNQSLDSAIFWFHTRWKETYLAYAAVVCAVLGLVFGRAFGKGHGAEQAAATWGTIAFALLLLFMLGASQDTERFFTMFACGAVGAALGYLTGVALSPVNEDEDRRIAKAQGMVATLLAGAVGTKLLSLWDTVTRTDNPMLFRPEFYLPLLSTAAGYFVALAAFYTLRTFADGGVRITAERNKLAQWTDAQGKVEMNGVAADVKVQFAGAANFPDDVSVSWELQRPVGSAATAPPAGGPTIDAKSGVLTAPPQAWITANQQFLDWEVVARSNRDTSRFATFRIRLI